MPILPMGYIIIIIFIMGSNATDVIKPWNLRKAPMGRQAVSLVLKNPPVHVCQAAVYRRILISIFIKTRLDHMPI